MLSQSLLRCDIYTHYLCCSRSRGCSHHRAFQVRKIKKDKVCAQKRQQRFNTAPAAEGGPHPHVLSACHNHPATATCRMEVPLRPYLCTHVEFRIPKHTCPQRFPIRNCRPLSAFFVCVFLLKHPFKETGSGSLSWKKLPGCVTGT